MLLGLEVIDARTGLRHNRAGNLMGDMAILRADDNLRPSCRPARTSETVRTRVPADKGLIVQYLNYELPEIIVVNCSDKYIKLKAILE